MRPTAWIRLSRPPAAALGVPLLLAGLLLPGLADPGLLVGGLLPCLLLGEGVLVLALYRWACAPEGTEVEPLYRCTQHQPASPEAGAGWLVPAILALALLLRLVRLDAGLWYDEVVTLTEFVRLPCAELVRTYGDQNHHPLFSLAGWTSVQVFGESAWALRLPAVLFGVASLAALYRLARLVAPKPEPLLALLLLAVAYQHVWFSQSARGYTGLLLGVLLGSEVFLRLLDRPSLGCAATYSAVMALALYTHLTGGFVLAAHALIYLGLLGRKALRRRPLSCPDLVPLGAFVLAGLWTLHLYAPIVPQVLGSFHRQAAGPRVGAWTAPAWGLAQVLDGLRSSFAGTTGAVLAGAIATAGLLSYLRRNPVLVALLLVPCALGAAVMLLLGRHLYPRFFFPVFGFATLVAVRGAWVLGQWSASLAPRATGEGARRWAGGACAVGLVLLSLAGLPACYRLPKQDYAAALACVAAGRSAEDPVVAVGMAAIPLARYYAPDVSVADSAEQLETVRRRHPHRPTWLVYTFRPQMEACHPDVLRVIDRDFAFVRSFPGTVAGGAVIVCRARPLLKDEG